MLKFERQAKRNKNSQNYDNASERGYACSWGWGLQLYQLRKME